MPRHARHLDLPVEVAADDVKPALEHIGESHAQHACHPPATGHAALATGARLKAFGDTTEIDDPRAFIAEHRLALLIADEPVPADTPAVVRPGGAPAPGAAAPDAVVIDVDDIHSLVYSSGTSGRLKGVEISAKGTEYVINRFIDAFGMTGRDRHLIFLPLANNQQRLSVYLCLWLGADLVLAPYQRVFQAVRKEGPTFLIGPPVFYDTALQLYTKSGGDASLGDFLGGRIRFMITGMAPIRRETLDGYWSRDVPLLEAYGLTETGMVAWNTPDRHRVGTVGQLMDPESVTFLDDGEVIILPAATRYEQEGGGTETTTERRIIFSPEIPGHRVGEARSEWRGNY